MDFTYPPEAERFRQEIRGWLKKNLPEGWGTPKFRLPEEPKQRRAWQVAWHKKLYASGYIGMGWPQAYGGQGADMAKTMVLNEEMTRAKAPGNANGLAIGMLGPTLIQHGSEEQKRRYLPKILTCDEVWCQGFSEPGAGSDLASLQTRAVRDGDDYIINGQKVWTSLAHWADHIFMLVRTDPQAPKHKGISMIMVDMSTPGVTVRPLIQITGEHEFNEVFFDNVRVPRANLIGEENQGWYIGMTTLGFERAGGAGAIRFKLALDELVALAKKSYRNGRPAFDDPAIRQRLAQLAIECEIIKFNGYRDMTVQLRGGVPGPEASFGKLFWSEMNQRLSSLALQILGPQGTLMKGSPQVVDEGEHLYAFLRARGNTIEQGTSEIQRNIIGERALGLPR